MLKYKYIFQIKYTEAILSNIALKLLCFEVADCSSKKEIYLLFIIIFGTLSFPLRVAVIRYVHII